MSKNKSDYKYKAHINEKKIKVIDAAAPPFSKEGYESFTHDLVCN